MADAPINQPFRPLGFYEGKYVYYSFLLQRVVSLSPVEHRKENLFNLAPLFYWKEHYGSGKGIEWERAVDSLIQTCAAEGLFSPANVVGRGIWIIDGKGVTHYGDEVLINGTRYKPNKIPPEIAGKKVFEVAESLHLGDPDAAANFTKIEEMLSHLHFHTAHAPMLIAGAVVCAMAAGALHWRPHTWLTGKSGSGKSAVMKVLLLILRNCTEHYVGETTEAGIRQDLRHDCRAIVFDEAEPKNPTAIQKINNVLNLLRQASSDETGKIAKGTVTGKGMNYKIRSCGFLASINANLPEEPDKNRFQVLEMGDPMPKEDYDKWQFAAENIFTKGFQAALHNRISENIMTLAANAKVFAAVLAQRFKDNRAGDQYGSIFAGYYLLTSTQSVTKEMASDLMMGIVFPPERDTKSIASDHDYLWNYMLDRMITFKKEKESTHGNLQVTAFERPLAELIDVAFGDYSPLHYSKDHAERALADRGMKAVTEDGVRYVAISTNHTGITELISRSRCGGIEWSPVLRRITGAMAGEKPYKIGIGRKLTRVTLIPWHEEKEEPKSTLTLVL
jgi:putative DNA primase/helicase